MALFVLILVIAGTLVGLVAAELAARIVDHARCVDHLGGLHRREPRWGWGNRPGATGWAQRCLHQQPEWRTWIRIDADGLRGDEVPEAAPLGTQRILVLGDSFTFAGQVAEEQRYTSQLATLLRARGGRPAEILNAGVDGWGTDNALLFFEERGWRYHPDLVLLAFDAGNDVFENTRRLVSTSPFWPDKPYFTLDGGRLVRHNFPLRPETTGVPALRAAGAALMRHSTLARLSLEYSSRGMIFVALPAPGPTPDAVAAQPLDVLLRDYPAHWEDAWALTEALVVALRDAVEARGQRFAVVIVNQREEVSAARLAWARKVFPSLGAGECDPDKPTVRITSILERHGIAGIRLLDAFRAGFDADALPGYFAWDMHWAPAGHALAARVIADGIERQGLLPTDTPEHAAR